MGLDLDAIQARADAATPGPWYARSPQQPFQIVSDTANICGIHDGGQTSDSCLANARFIAYARDYVPALVAELRAARQVVSVGRSHVHAEEMDSSMGAATWSALRDAIAAYDRLTEETPK